MKFEVQIPLWSKKESDGTELFQGAMLVKGKKVHIAIVSPAPDNNENLKIVLLRKLPKTANIANPKRDPDAVMLLLEIPEDAKPKYIN